MEFRHPFDPATGGPGDGSVAWTNGDPATGTEGSIPPVEALTDPQLEICHLIDFALGDGSAGSGQNVADTEQLRKAVQAMLADFIDQDAADSRYLRGSVAETLSAAFKTAVAADKQLSIGKDTGAVRDPFIDFYDGEAVRRGYIQALAASIRISRDGGGVFGIHGTGDVRIDGDKLATEDFAGDAGNLTTGTLSSARVNMATLGEAQDGTHVARFMNPLRVSDAFVHFMANLGPDDVGSRLHCAVNSTAFAVGDSFSGASLHPSSSRNSSALTAGGGSSGSSVTFERPVGVLSGTWEALAPSDGAAGSTVTRWADFIKVSE